MDKIQDDILFNGWCPVMIDNLNQKELMQIDVLTNPSYRNLLDHADFSLSHTMFNELVTQSFVRVRYTVRCKNKEGLINQRRDSIFDLLTLGSVDTESLNEVVKTHLIELIKAADLDYVRSESKDWRQDLLNNPTIVGSCRSINSALQMTVLLFYCNYFLAFLVEAEKSSLFDSCHFLISKRNENMYKSLRCIWFDCLRSVFQSIPRTITIMDTVEISLIFDLRLPCARLEHQIIRQIYEMIKNDDENLNVNLSEDRLLALAMEKLRNTSVYGKNIQNILDDTNLFEHYFHDQIAILLDELGINYLSLSFAQKLLTINPTLTVENKMKYFLLDRDELIRLLNLFEIGLEIIGEDKWKFDEQFLIFNETEEVKFNNSTNLYVLIQIGQQFYQVSPHESFDCDRIYECNSDPLIETSLMNLIELLVSPSTIKDADSIVQLSTANILAQPDGPGLSIIVLTAWLKVYLRVYALALRRDSHDAIMSSINKLLANTESGFCSTLKIFIMKNLCQIYCVDIEGLYEIFFDRTCVWIKTVFSHYKYQQQRNSGQNIILPTPLFEAREEYININNTLKVNIANKQWQVLIDNSLKLYNDFIEAWYQLSFKEVYLDSQPIKFEHKYPSEEFRQKTEIAKLFINSPRDPNSLLLIACIKTISDLQNNIVQQFYNIMNSNSADKRVQPQTVPLQSLQPKHLLCLDNDMISRKLMNDASVVNYEYGKGKDIIYDFEEIEFMVREKISCLPLIDTDKIHYMSYQFELYEENASLISDIRRNSEQKLLPEKKRSELQKLIDSISNDDILHYIGSLDQIFTYLRHCEHKSMHSLTVKTFIEQHIRSKMGLCDKLCQDSNSSTIELRYIVDFYQLLEEIAFEKILRNHIEQDSRGPLLISVDDETYLIDQFIQATSGNITIAPCLKNLDCWINTLKRLLLRVSMNTNLSFDVPLQQFTARSDFWTVDVTANDIQSFKIANDILLRHAFIILKSLEERKRDSQGERRSHPTNQGPNTGNSIAAQQIWFQNQTTMKNQREVIGTNTRTGEEEFNLSEDTKSKDISLEEKLLDNREMDILGIMSLSSMNITDDDMILIIQRVFYNHKSKCIGLILRDNALTSTGVKMLVDTLISSQTKLKYLSLSNNPNIGDKGIEHLTNLLQKNRSITFLALPNTGITDHGVRLLADVLCGIDTVLSCTSLKKLHISFNKSITDQSFETLIQIIEQNQTLKLLSSQHCSLSVKIRRTLRKAVIKNKKKRFSLSE
ncbi:unnamed protein product [Rotaria sp. Silwood1]|nr:unnamed protein product [Rotaria sp. Silwood1]